MTSACRRNRPTRVEPTLDVLAEIDAALRQLAPGYVVSGVRAVDQHDEAALHPEELVALGGAVPARRQQFATGRALLRHLLGSDVAIGVAPDRRPLLPAGVVASLAHDHELAVAAVSTEQCVAGLGIDVEPIAEISDITASIVRADDAITEALTAFVVKEAAYKAWSRPGWPILDHHDLLTSVTPGGQIVATVIATGDTIPVDAVMVAGRWLALAICRNDG